MHLKDHYSILGVEPSASIQEIKKAYRRLALQYHPDKNQDDPYAAVQFNAIKEAYEILTNPTKKEYYLQQRWYNQSIGKRKVQTIVTPVTVLKQVLELDKYVSTRDIHRMDKEGLYSYICDILSDDTVEKLNAFNDITINKEIISVILKCITLLPVRLADDLQGRLLRIKADEASIEKIKTIMRSFHSIQRWEKYRVWFLLLIAAGLSLLIFFLSE